MPFTDHPALAGLSNFSRSFAETHIREYEQLKGKPLPTEFGGIDARHGFVVCEGSPMPGRANHQLWQRVLAIAPSGSTLSLYQARELGLLPHNLRTWLNRQWLKPAPAPVEVNQVILIRGKKPNHTVDHTRDSWRKVDEALDLRGGEARYEELVEAVRGHPGGEVPFIKYCMREGWLIEKKTTGTDEDTRPGQEPSQMTALNIILYGPPGTGKTYETAAQALSIFSGKVPKSRNDAMDRYKSHAIKFDDAHVKIEAGHIAFVTFHQSYSYEDFVEGIRPVTKDGVVTYEVRKGIFRLMCDRACSDPDHNYVLIIDEINRANISKVFGELITLIEPDKRLGGPNEIQVVLPYSGDTFGVPKNLYLIGTMNTADRSIALLDTALRRRFVFEEMLPEPALLKDRQVKDRQVKDIIVLKTLLAELNRRVEYLYDRDHTIGHAFFWDVNDLPDLDSAFRHKVIPLLQEFFHEDWQKIAAALNEPKSGGGFLEIKALPAPVSEWSQDFAYEEKWSYRVNPKPFPITAFHRLANSRFDDPARQDDAESD